MSPVDIALAQAYLANAQTALQNRAVEHGAILIECVQKLLMQSPAPLPCTPPFVPPMQINVSIGLDAGIKRQGKPNEDFAFAATGTNTQAQETYGLFVVADGMGGHANGQTAARLAIETVVNTILPFLHHACETPLQPGDLGKRLIDAVTQANTVIYQQNRETSTSQPLDQMGTTLTATAVFGPHAFVANVGDSRAYLYRPGSGLRVITRDHSVVAGLVALGEIQPEEIYTHAKRNQIYRAVGTDSAVEVDLFSLPLQDGDWLLLCTDGVWEMTRDHHIEEILASSMSAEQMTRRLIQLAYSGGGRDNIGLVVSQICMSMTAMDTMLLHSSAAVS